MRYINISLMFLLHFIFRYVTFGFSHGCSTHYCSIFIILMSLFDLFSVDELRKLLADKDAYHQFLLSLDQVKIQNNVSTEAFLSIGNLFIM